MLLPLALMVATGLPEAVGHTMAAPIAVNGVYSVADSASLYAAVSSAQAGDRIALTPGDYTKLFINRPVEGGSITISGPRGARIAMVQFGERAEGWTVEGLTVVAGPGPMVGVQVTGARRITLDRLAIIGNTPAAGPEEEQTWGIRIQRARAVVVSGTDITHVKIATAMFDSSGLILSGNRIHGVREGFNISYCSGVAVRNNDFRDLRPRYDLSEHPDMIQLWTRNRPTGSSNVEISHNLLMSGRAQPVQGVFIRAEDFESGANPQGFHRDIRVGNNIYYGSSGHGITMGDVQGAVVENNIVLPSPHAFVGKVPADPTGKSSSGFVPRISFFRSTTGRLSGNIFGLLNLPPNPAAVLQQNNLMFVPRVPEDGRNPGGSFLAALETEDYEAGRFALKPRSAAARSGQGTDPARIGPAAAQSDVAALAAEAARLAAASP